MNEFLFKSLDLYARGLKTFLKNYIYLDDIKREIAEQKLHNKKESWSQFCSDWSSAILQDFFKEKYNVDYDVFWKELNTDTKLGSDLSDYLNYQWEVNLILMAFLDALGE